MVQNAEIKEAVVKTKIIFEGKIRPGTYYEGTYRYPKTRKDKFGILKPGHRRSFLISTKYGQLHLPQCYGYKKVRITLEEIK